ncbi:MAG: hypothetical protein GY847_32475 [Proteobacteria bacterium]|nr:hypothetical protein [Pseudomonadota bacterium]
MSINVLQNQNSETPSLFLYQAEQRQWQEGYSRLLKFVEREGHANVPENHIEDKFGLGEWLMRCRRDYRKGRLPTEHQELLEKQPGWFWREFDMRWWRAFHLLRSFVENEGHIRVPRNHIENGGFKLGIWIERQRSRKATMPKERREALEKIPGWSWSLTKEKWEKGHNYLLEFVEREKHALVPRNYVEEGFKLGQWVVTQRVQKRGNNLSEEKREALEKVSGWCWNVHENQWKEGYQRLLSFYEREGHTRVPYAHIEDGFKLGRWVEHKRERKDRLSKEREAILGKIGFWTSNNVHYCRWEESYQYLLTFVKREGHARVPHNHVEDSYKLGRWVTRLRTRKDKLSAERKSILEQLPGWVWNAKRIKTAPEQSFKKSAGSIDSVSQTLYETLAEKTRRDFDGYETPRLLPNEKIPGELAFFLDDLLDLASNELKQEKPDALAEVIDLGITAWYKRLDSETRARLGLPFIVVERSELQELRAKLADAGQREEAISAKSQQERTRFQTETAKLRAELHEERAQLALLKSKRQVLDTAQEMDLEDAKTQAAVFAQDPITTVYTPMTAHSLNRDNSLDLELKSNMTKRRRRRSLRNSRK